MNIISMEKWGVFLLITLALALPHTAYAQLEFSNIVVFGTSLSDPGNGFSLLAHPEGDEHPAGTVSQNVPPYDALDEFLVPSAPYPRGGHHFSNGATWIEQFARARGFAADTRPAFQGNSHKAANYAVSGARAVDFPDRVNLPHQVQAFLEDVGQVAPAEALYVIEIGSNDLRDALVEFLTVFEATGDPNQAAVAAQAIITAALESIASHIEALYLSGSRKFLVWNAARLDLLPAVRALDAIAPGAVTIAANLTDGFNLGLAQNVLNPLSGLPGIEIAPLNVADKMTAIFDSPESFGLTNVMDPCISPNTPPFTCRRPDHYFFWDGIHPTKVVHAILADLAADVLAHYPLLPLHDLD